MWCDLYWLKNLFLQDETYLFFCFVLINCDRKSNEAWYNYDEKKLGLEIEEIFCDTSKVRLAKGERACCVFWRAIIILIGEQCGLLLGVAYPGCTCCVSSMRRFDGMKRRRISVGINLFFSSLIIFVSFLFSLSSFLSKGEKYAPRDERGGGAGCSHSRTEYNKARWKAGVTSNWKKKIVITSADL